MKRNLLRHVVLSLILGASVFGLYNTSQAQLTGNFVQGFSYTPTDPVND